MEKTYNYLLKVEYDGTNYSGWQFQKMGNLFKKQLKSFEKKILKIKIKINGAGRTDKGVHAFGQHANFKINQKIENEKKIFKFIKFFFRKKIDLNYFN